MPKRTVGVIFGSRSVEHDVSIVTAQQVIEILRARPEKYEVVPIYITRDGVWLTGEGLFDISAFQQDQDMADRFGFQRAALSPGTDHAGLIVPPLSGRLRKNRVVRLDVAFPAMHGPHGEDGTVQGLLELADIPYVGAGVMASAIGMDKVMTKIVLMQNGLPVVDYVAFTRKEWIGDHDGVIERIEAAFPYPVFVKPANLGSSIGITRATDRDALRRAMDVAASFDRRLLVEPALQDLTEINCAVLGNDDMIASACEKPISWEEFLTYEEKYMRAEGGMKGAAREIPAPISDEMTARLQRMAVQAFKAIGGRGTARVDFMLSGGEVYINEVNTMPGSIGFYLWKESDIGPGDLVDKLIELALEAHAEKRQTTYTYRTGLVAHAAAHGVKGAKKL